MEFTPPHFDLAKLRHKIDIRNMTIHVEGRNFHQDGRFYLLWRDGFFLVIQAEPWWQPGKAAETGWLDERRAVWHIREVIQTMLDTIVIDGEHIWACLIRLKNGTYHLVYKKRQLVTNCLLWTKVVELGDIELTRFASGLCWEGTYEGKDVDLLIGWNDSWGQYISDESQGLKLVQSRGVGQYFFDLKAHVSQNGVIVGLMMEPIIGRCVRLDDRSAVYDAMADILRHGITFLFQICDIYITERGVRFASASSATYFNDLDKLAKSAEFTWKGLAAFFDPTCQVPFRGHLSGSRAMISRAFIMPRLPSPASSISLTPEEAMIRWVWSVVVSDMYIGLDHLAFKKLPALYHPDCSAANRRKRKKVLLPPVDFSDDPESSVARISPIDEQDRPLVVHRISAPRWRPYIPPKPKRLLLPRESD